jgi:ribosomal protein S18 acetylase RimI-like enzyme
MMIFTHDKKKLLKHFRKHEVLFAYHIGDLDDFYFPDCQWAAAFNPRTGIDDVLLTYTGCDTPTLLAFGLGERFDELLKDYLPIAPSKFFCHFQKEHRSVFAEFAEETPLGTHQKMSLDLKVFANLPNVSRPNDPAIIRLTEPDEIELRTLYAAAYPETYFVPRMLQTGKYIGYRSDGRLVAVAGVHVSSDEHRIAVLGNLTTHPDHRGEGLATLLMERLTRELVGEGKTVCLNVKCDNAPAITCYERLGFVKVHKYEEALFKLH